MIDYFEEFKLNKINNILDDNNNDILDDSIDFILNYTNKNPPYLNQKKKTKTNKY